LPTRIGLLAETRKNEGRQQKYSFHSETLGNYFTLRFRAPICSGFTLASRTGLEGVHRKVASPATWPKHPFRSLARSVRNAGRRNHTTIRQLATIPPDELPAQLPTSGLVETNFTQQSHHGDGERTEPYCGGGRPASSEKTDPTS
jgi:hypothetical protein